MSLFHLSDEGDIARFEPRPSAYTEEPVVWAIEAARLANYLVPRDCPRVCFRAGANTSADDVKKYLGEDRAVLAIEVGWLERLRTGGLYRYTMPRDGFALQDEGAGYWVARTPVTPLGVERVSDLAAAIANEGVTLRILPSLWDLHDEVKTSSLVFSMIRMWNAAERIMEPCPAPHCGAAPDPRPG